MAIRQTGFLIFGAVAALMVMGCASPEAPFSPPKGFVYSSVKAPLQIEFKEGGEACATAEGEASSLFLHDWLFTGISIGWKDCSIQRAAQEGGLSSVSYADYETFTLLGFFGKTTVRAYGTRPGQAAANPAR